MLCLLIIILTVLTGNLSLHGMDRRFCINPSTGQQFMLVQTQFGPRWLPAQAQTFAPTPTAMFRAPIPAPQPPHQLRIDAPEFHPTPPPHIALALRPAPSSAAELELLHKDFNAITHGEAGPRVFIVPDTIGNTALHLAVARGNAALATLIFDVLTSGEKKYVLRIASTMQQRDTSMPQLEAGDTIVHVALKHLQTLIETRIDATAILTFLTHILPMADLDGENFSLHKPSSKIFSARAFFETHLATIDVCNALQQFFFPEEEKAKKSASAPPSTAPILPQPHVGQILSPDEALVADVAAMRLTPAKTTPKLQHSSPPMIVDAATHKSSPPPVVIATSETRLLKPIAVSPKPPLVATVQVKQRAPIAQKPVPQKPKKQQLPALLEPVGRSSRKGRQPQHHAKPAAPAMTAPVNDAPIILTTHHAAPRPPSPKAVPPRKATPPPAVKAPAPIDPLVELFSAVEHKDIRHLEQTLATHKKALAKLRPWHSKSSGNTPLYAALKNGFINGVELISQAIPALVTQANHDGSRPLDFLLTQAHNKDICTLFQVWVIDGVIDLGVETAGITLRTQAEAAGLIDKQIPKEITPQEALDVALKKRSVTITTELMRQPHMAEAAVHKIFGEPDNKTLQQVFNREPQLLITILQTAGLEPVSTFAAIGAYHWIELLHEKKCLTTELLLAQSTDDESINNALSFVAAAYHNARTDGNYDSAEAIQEFAEQLLIWLPLAAWSEGLPAAQATQIQETIALMQTPWPTKRM